MSFKEKLFEISYYYLRLKVRIKSNVFPLKMKNENIQMFFSTTF